MCLSFITNIFLYKEVPCICGEMMEQYRCTRCKQIKDESSFRKMTGRMKLERKRPVRYWCKSCEHIYITSSDNKSLAATRAKREREKSPHKIWAKSSIFQHKRRNHDVIITWEELTNMAILTTHCPICGCKLDWGTKKSGKAIAESPSLDRFDNCKKITTKNSWIICHFCNMAKGEKTIVEFIEYCKHINNRGGIILQNASDLTLMVR